MAKYNETLDQSAFDEIEAYLLDRMDVATRAAFEQKLGLNPDLAAEVALQRGLMATLNVSAFFEGKRKVNTTKHSILNIKTYLAAASVVVLCGIALWFYKQKVAPNDAALYSNFYQEDHGLPVEMGKTDSTEYLFYDGMINYREEKYAEAVKKWEELENSAMSDTIQYYLGHANLHLNHTEKSIREFKKVVANKKSAYREQATWYLALAYLKNGDRANAKLLLKGILSYPGAKALYSKL